MRNLLVLVAAVVTLLAVLAPEARAAAPICLSTTPFLDVFVWVVSPTGGNQFAGTGRDLSGDRAQTVSGISSGTIVTVGFMTYPSTSDTVPVTGGGTIDLTTGSGPGTCFGPDFASCGDFTFTVIPCPSGATTHAAGDGGRTGGRVQGVVP